MRNIIIVTCFLSCLVGSARGQDNTDPECHALVPATVIDGQWKESYDLEQVIYHGGSDEATVVIHNSSTSGAMIGYSFADNTQFNTLLDKGASVVLTRVIKVSVAAIEKSDYSSDGTYQVIIERE